VIKQPMLGVQFEEGSLRFPYYASPKLDGIRCLCLDGEARTRSMKRIPNLYVRDWFAKHRDLLANLDGELVVGPPTAPDCYNKTATDIMAHGGRPDFGFYVFDVVDDTGKRPFTDRWGEVIERSRSWPANVGTLLQEMVATPAALKMFEAAVLKQGFEGVMLRGPESRYKQGRATLRENSLLKVKRFVDAEAIVVGVEEQMTNTNPARRNEIGRTFRSSAQAGLVGKGTLGALTVKGSPGQPFAGVTFSIGAGFDDALRAEMWRVRDKLVGLQVRYRFFDVGTKDAPRHPIFSGFRKEGT
jgi:DNA ligase-1